MEPQATLQILTAFEQMKIDGINCISIDENHRDREVVYIGWNTSLHVFIKYIAPLYNLWYQSFVKSSSIMVNIGFLFRINNTTIIVNRGHGNKNEIKQNNKQVIALLQPDKYDKLYEILLKLLLNLKNNTFDEQSILSLIQRFVSDELEEEIKLNPDAVPFVPSNSSVPCSSLAPYVLNGLRNRAKRKLQTIQEHMIAIYDNSPADPSTNRRNNIETNTLQSLFPILINADDVYELSLIPVVISRNTQYMTSMAFDSNSLGVLNSMVMNSHNRNRFRFNDNNLIIPTTKMITAPKQNNEKSMTNSDCKESKSNEIAIVQNKKTKKNKKNNNRKKKQRMKKRNMKFARNKSDYYPSQANESVSNIIKTISKKMTTVIIPSKATQTNIDWYKYMRKLTVMHFNDHPNSIHDDICAIHYDIYDRKTNEEYYHIIEGGKMIDELFTKKDIMNMKMKNNKLKIYTCPTHKFKQQLKYDLDGIITCMNTETVSINWCTVDIFIKKNNKQRMVYQITNDEFKKKIHNALNWKKICQQDLLPVIMFRSDKHWMEWVWKCRIEKDIVIGIAFKYEDNVLNVMGIHLDIAQLVQQNELIRVDDCDVESLNDWTLYKNINDIQINGNLDDDKNRFKAHCKSEVDMFEYVMNAINSGQKIDISKLQIHKKNAQHMLEQL